MNILDIIVIILLILSIFQGYKQGILVQLGGIVGILIGIWLAYRFSTRVGLWLGMDEEIAYYAAFALIVLASIVILGFAGWCAGKVFNLVGLGIINRLGGAVLSLAKTVLIVGVLLMAFNAINRHSHWVGKKYFSESLLYAPILEVTDYVFPYLGKAADALSSMNDSEDTL